MSDFVYIVAEGVQDVAFVGKLLTTFHGASRVRRMEDLSTEHAAWMKSFSWPLETRRGTEIDRFSVPAPAFYRLASGATVALRSAEGIDKIFSTLERDRESFTRSANEPRTVGIVLDSDDKPVADRLSELKKRLASLDLATPDHLATVSDGPPRVGVFAVPEPGVDGTLEDLLLEIGDVSYPELAESARGYAEGWRVRAQAGLTGAEWKLIKKPSGGKKATVAAMTAILKPGYAAQVSIEQNEWLGEKAKALPCLQPCVAFLKALLVPDSPVSGGGAPAQGSPS